jgi:prepilin-type N-terminal cleavage/methylation domain-containing protein
MSRAQGRVGIMRGFTLIELMIVVVIIAVLAAVAIPAYRKYSDSGRTAEAMAMLGEFRAKEEAYRAENNTYLSTDVNEATYYPVLGNCASGSTEPCPKTIPTASSWSSTPPLDKWLALGITPNHTQLYCGYVAIAGTAGAWGNAGTDGKNMFSNVAPTVNWYYLHASCDNNSSKSQNTTYTTAMNTTSIFTQNDHY